MATTTVNEIVGQYQISSGVTKADLKSLAENPKTSSIQFSATLDEKDADHLEAIVFSQRPDILLRVYGHYSEECDLQFLERIPSLRKLSVDSLRSVKRIEAIANIQNIETLGVGVFELDNFDFLSKITPTLKELSLHQTRSKKPKIESIARFQDLEYLYLEGQSNGIDEIRNLNKLEKVVLRSISTENLDYLAGKEHLWSVDIKLGGIKSFEALKTLPNLKYLELWQISGLTDLSFISSLESLQNLYVQSLSKVEKLPSFDRLKKLKRIYLENLKSLEDLSSVKYAENLKEFIFVAAQSQEPEDMQPALDNPSVASVLCVFGSDKKNSAFDNLATKANKEKYKWSKFRYE
jgi:hypothetical protein